MMSLKEQLKKQKVEQMKTISAARYEGFGSAGGGTVIIDCLTDNANRTICGFACSI